MAHATIPDPRLTLSEAANAVAVLVRYLHQTPDGVVSEAVGKLVASERVHAEKYPEDVEALEGEIQMMGMLGHRG